MLENSNVHVLQLFFFIIIWGNSHLIDREVFLRRLVFGNPTIMCFINWHAFCIIYFTLFHAAFENCERLINSLV